MHRTAPLEKHWTSGSVVVKNIITGLWRCGKTPDQSSGLIRTSQLENPCEILERHSLWLDGTLHCHNLRGFCRNQGALKIFQVAFGGPGPLLQHFILVSNVIFLLFMPVASHYLAKFIHIGMTFSITLTSRIVERVIIYVSYKRGQ